jgi:HD-GYP domain-containing protein (c-di-GMP phosphodiesterase class II)
MTSPRPHRPALSEAEALRELAAAAGRHLDARLIDALRSVLTHPRETDARAADAA